MMDASAVGSGIGPEVTSSSKTSSKGSGSDNGFRDALTSHASGKEAAADKTSGEQQNDSGQPGEQELPMAQRLRRANWLQEHSLSAQAQGRAKGDALAGKAGAGGKVADTDERTKTGAVGSTHSEEAAEDLAAAKDVVAKGARKVARDTEGLDEPSPTDGAEATKGRASGKGEPALGEVLTLLNGAEAGAAANARGTASGKAGEAAGSTARRSQVTDATSLRTGADDAEAATAGENDPAVGKTFRFARADGRGATMEMTISGRDSREISVRNGGEQGDLVTVLDARRYLGLAQGSNSSAVVSSLSGDGEWSAAMQPSSALSNAAAWSSTGKVVNTLKIQMHPIELGLVTATMRLKGEELTVELTVETRAAYRQLSEDQRKIVEALKAQGFAVDQVSIAVSNADRADPAASQPGQQGQSAGQQTTQGNDGGSRSTGQGDGQQERNRGAAGDGMAAEKQSGSASGPGGARPDHLYI